MNKKMTPWFPAQIKPAHIGVYETEDVIALEAGRHCYQHWNGYWWGMCCSTATHAAIKGNADYRSLFQESPWRGLAKKP